MPVRPELEALPPRIARLPLDERGYPVPWFVAYVDGKPEFRAADAEKWKRAVIEKLCWVCGDPLGIHLAFVLGPMCGITRTTAEPPCHLECAQWSARNCPFLNLTMQKRREDDKINNANLAEHSAGIPIARQPGVTGVWITRSYRLFPDGSGKYLIRVGEPETVEWYSEGKPASKMAVEASVASGLPILEDVARQQDGGLAALAKEYDKFLPLLPQEAPWEPDHAGDRPARCPVR